jgi:hypothetical protein
MEGRGADARAKCYSCHGGEKTKGDVDLKQFAANPDVPVNFEIWNTVKDTIDNGDMPPRKAKQLSSEEKAASPAGCSIRSICSRRQNPAIRAR